MCCRDKQQPVVLLWCMGVSVQRIELILVLVLERVQVLVADACGGIAVALRIAGAASPPAAEDAGIQRQPSACVRDAWHCKGCQ